MLALKPTFAHSPDLESAFVVSAAANPSANP
jgi:hypothetical protein